MTRSGRRGGLLPTTLVIVFLTLVIGMALGVLATSNLQLASYEANREAAMEVARAGIHQYLYNLDNTPTSSTKIQLSTLRSFSFLRSTLALSLPPTRTPYPIPNSRLPGVCYLTFNRNLPYFSVDNLSSTTPATGWQGRVVPPFCLDLIASGVVNGVEKHIECLVSRRWDYALGTPCPIDIGGTMLGSNPMPSIIQGDVFTAASYSAGQPVINVGRIFDTTTATWASSSNNAIDGWLRVAPTNQSSVYVDTAQNNAVTGTKFGTTESTYPEVQMPNTSGWTDLAATYTYANRADHEGSYLTHYVDATTGHDCYAIESDGTGGSQEMVLPAGSYVLHGDLVGSTATGAASTATDLVLNDASLKVDGDVRFRTHPKRIYGNKSLLWVTGDVTFKDGFIDGGDNGMVLYARSLTTKAGGCLKGLVLVEDSISMEPFDADLVSGSTAALTFDALRVKSVSSLIAGSYVKIGERRVNKMYINGGVFTPKDATTSASSRFVFRSVDLTWDPTYLKALHDYADRKICYWQEIP